MNIPSPEPPYRNGYEVKRTLIDKLPAIITAVGASIALVVTAYVALVQARQGEVLTNVHTLTNSNYGVQLITNRDLSAWKAKTTKDKADIAAAKKAQKALDVHKAQQSIVDAGS